MDRKQPPIALSLILLAAVAAIAGGSPSEAGNYLHINDTGSELLPGDRKIGDDRYLALTGAEGCGIVTLDKENGQKAPHIYYTQEGTIIRNGSTLGDQLTDNVLTRGCERVNVPSRQACTQKKGPYSICETGEAGVCDGAWEYNDLLHSSYTGSSYACSTSGWKACTQETLGSELTTNDTTLRCADGQDGIGWYHTETRTGWRVDAWTEHPLKDLDYNNGTAIAVGAEGTAVHLNGTSWVERMTPAEGYLYDVEIVGPSLAYAVGQNGTVLRWDGTAWERMDPPVDDRLTGIDIDQDGDLWIAGGTITSRDELVRDWTSTGILLHHDDNWTVTTPPQDLFLTDIEMQDGEGTAVGFLGTVYAIDQDGTITSIEHNVTSIRNFIDVSLDEDDRWILSGGASHDGGMGWLIRAREGFEVTNQPFHGIFKFYDVGLRKEMPPLAVGKYQEEGGNLVKMAVLRWNRTTDKWERTSLPRQVTSSKTRSRPLTGYLQSISIINDTAAFAVGGSRGPPHAGGIIVRRSKLHKGIE